MHTIREVKDHFEAGHESVTLSKAEWTSIYEIMQTYAANHNQMRKAEKEAERIKRIARPVWRACGRVQRQMRALLDGSRDDEPRVALPRLAAWERSLRLAMVIDRKDSVAVGTAYPPGER